MGSKPSAAQIKARIAQERLKPPASQGVRTFARESGLSRALAAPAMALESALATLENCPVVLTLLNKSPASEAGSYYGYYGYGQ